MAKKNKKWTQDEDRIILDMYVTAPKSRRLALGELQAEFAWSGYHRSLDALRQRAFLLRQQKQRTDGIQRYQQWFDGMRVGYFDIETYGFKANFGLMLSWAMYVPDKFMTIDQSGQIDIGRKGKTYSDAMTRKEAIDYTKLDKRITKSLIKAFDKVDMVIGYYSTRFDVPFVRTRAAMHRLPKILYHQKYHYDMWFTVRSLYALTRNTLEQACAMVGIEGKTHVDYALWDRARLGDSKAMDYILDHNVADVEILAELHREISGQRPLQRRSL